MLENPNLDTLQHILDSVHFDARFFANPTFCSHWQAGPDQPMAAFHLVGEGRCYLHLAKQPPLLLDGGDVVVLLKPLQHKMSSEAKLSEQDFVAPERPLTTPTTLICGWIRFDLNSPNLLLQSLPDMILIRRCKLTNSDAFDSLLRLLSQETRHQDAGSRLVLDKLAGALFVMVLRHYLLSTAAPTGLIAALTDPRLQPVLAAMHEELGRNWRLEELAQKACMSRSAFAAHFKETLGMTPGTYLTHWRMTQARLWLGDSRYSVPRIAEHLGYSSEAAFRRAFKRCCGESPGRVRREARNASSLAA